MSDYYYEHTSRQRWNARRIRLQIIASVGAGAYRKSGRVVENGAGTVQTCGRLSVRSFLNFNLLIGPFLKISLYYKDV